MEKSNIPKDQKNLPSYFFIVANTTKTLYNFKTESMKTIKILASLLATFLLLSCESYETPEKGTRATDETFSSYEISIEDAKEAVSYTHLTLPTT